VSPYISTPQRLTQLLLGILAVGVWSLLLKPYLPIATAEAKSPSAVRHPSIRSLCSVSMLPMPMGLRA
jgi:hypothetical protein